MIRWVITNSVIDSINGLRKPYLTRYMVETMIQNVKDIEEKRFLIKKYNEKLKRSGLEERYEPLPFEEI